MLVGKEVLKKRKLYMKAERSKKQLSFRFSKTIWLPRDMMASKS